METAQPLGDQSARSRSRGQPSRAGSPVSFHPASQAGDFFRDTNALSNKGSNSNLRGTNRAQSAANMSQFGAVAPQVGPMSTMGMNPFATMQSMGSMPFLPYPTMGSAAGSDYGGMLHPQMTGTVMGPGSIYGGGMGVPRNSVMTNLNMFGGGPGSVAGLGDTRPLSSFSVDPFGTTGPSPSENPTDDELLAFLRHYLSTQDLMSVTKK